MWIVEGLKNENFKDDGRNFASGGFETLGLKIVGDVIYTSGRQMTRYHDLNNDGAADHYESFNDDITSSQGFMNSCSICTRMSRQFLYHQGRPGAQPAAAASAAAAAAAMCRRTPSGVDEDRQVWRELTVVATGCAKRYGRGLQAVSLPAATMKARVPRCPINWVKPGGTRCGRSHPQEAVAFAS